MLTNEQEDALLARLREAERLLRAWHEAYGADDYDDVIHATANHFAQVNMESTHADE